jgi:hypothetical protein
MRGVMTRFLAMFALGGCVATSRPDNLRVIQLHLFKPYDIKGVKDDAAVSRELARVMPSRW